MYPSNWNWFSAVGASNSIQDKAILKGNQLLQFSCPSEECVDLFPVDALKQAKLTSVLEYKGEIQKWFQSLKDEDRITIEHIYQRYRRRRMTSTMSYQPV